MTARTLRQRRAQRGWTQVALAQKLGVSVRSVGRWEAGIIAIPVPIQKLATFVMPATGGKRGRSGAR